MTGHNTTMGKKEKVEWEKGFEVYKTGRLYY